MDNRKDLSKIPDNVRNEMEFVFVGGMDEVIAAAIMLDERQAVEISEDLELVAGRPSYPQLGVARSMIVTEAAS